MALSKKVKEEVVVLLQEGKLSKRAIHRKTGVSRVTIDKIEHSLLFPPKKITPPPKSIPRSKNIEFTECPDCGKRLVVNTPCLTCSLNKAPVVERDWLDQLLFPGG